MVWKQVFLFFKESFELFLKGEKHVGIRILIRRWPVMEDRKRRVGVEEVVQFSDDRIARCLE